MAFCPQTPSRSRVLSAASSLLLCEDGSIPRLYRHLHLADAVTLFGVYDLHGRGFVQPRFFVVVGGVVIYPVHLLSFRLVD